MRQSKPPGWPDLNGARSQRARFGKGTVVNEVLFHATTLIFAGLILAAPDYAPTRLQAKPTRQTIQPQVPEYFKIGLRLGTTKSVPLISRSQIEKALDLILSMKNDSALQTADDRVIYQLLDEYISGRRLYRLTVKVIVQHTDPDNLTIGRAAFSCARSEYAFNPHIRTSLPFLALSLYHELRHGVQCQNGEEFLDTPIKRCQHEAPAYAAQVRFFIALNNQGRLPNKVSIDEPGDAYLAEQTRQAWKALAESEHAFCKWYDLQMRAGSSSLLYARLVATD
jgi:hypothetical protein